MSSSTDSQTSPTLMERLRRQPKDARAWDRFVLRYQPKIYGWCRERGLQEADAEDVAQDVIAILTQKMASFRYDPSRRFRAWLKKITSHALSDLIARRCRAVGDRPTPLLESLEDRVDLEKRIDELFDRELLELAMASVRKRVATATWEAFRLTTFEGHSGAEASQRLGIPVASVFVSKHRVQKLLREVIARLEGAAEG
ncbi:RNA polymerase sigma factor [Singulisphaera acidiphila]|uniref:RNA polymerase sigma factor, sigma-70 family n=1 Tax=Singulisphaera acidiphila (strain ATCC BAA-1392 / DSM 18658 / VKM B-2454 / MOB10) TaxID=886293 RepID=L0DHE8_SINAD|nr:sigma-70 family RNA polymerase sigma factor [Singulisphaera acidiphila]AGA28238.1 RNA polymerase sigma factor, sigma-70 family [Singulisphaera acidiphila DSM 18658]